MKFLFSPSSRAAALLVLREWLWPRAARQPRVFPTPPNAAASNGNAGREPLGLCIGAYVHGGHLDSAAEFAYTRVTATTEARLIQCRERRVLVPISDVSDLNLHVYSVDASGTSLQFIVIRKPNGQLGNGL